MKYVFDSDALINLFRHYYPKRFPTLWDKFDSLVSAGEVVSVREVYNEIGAREDALSLWAKEQKSALFTEPTASELRCVGKIFAVRHFQAMVRKQERLRGKPVADPFVVARAITYECSVVTQEKNSENAARIPNVCDHFGIPCINLEGFMARENWVF